MKDFFLNALLYPFLAILFCLAFGPPPSCVTASQREERVGKFPNGWFALLNPVSA